MKKYISIILISLLIISLFCMPVFAKNKSVGAQNAEKLYAATGAVTLDETDSEFITRGEFLKPAVSVLGFDLQHTANKQYFLDVSAGEPLGCAVEYALALEMISPGEYYNPDSFVTYNQVAKILVTALGYDDRAKAAGDYPVGYIAQASSLQLFKGIYNKGDEPFLKSDFYILMRNFLESDIRNVERITNRNGKTLMGFVKEGNVLECVYGWEYFQGIVNGDENTSLFDKNLTYKNAVCIGSQVMLYDGEYTIGTSVFGYSYEEDGKKTAMYIEETQNNNIVFINGEDAVVSNTGVRQETADGKTKTYYFNSLFSIIYNGKASYKELSFLADKIDVGGLTLIDNDGDNKYDVCYVKNGSIMEVASVNESTETIYDAKLGQTVSFKDKDNVRVYKGGNRVFINTIRQGSVIEYYTSEDGTFSEIYILDNIVTGKLTGKTADSVFIDDKEYYIKKYFKNAYWNTMTLGTVCSFVLATDGKVAAIAPENETEMTLGYLSKFGIDEPFATCVEMKVFTEKNTYMTYQTTEKVVLNNVSCKPEELFDKLSQKGEQLIRFSVNSDGKICKIYTADTVGTFDPLVDSVNTLKRYPLAGYDNVNNAIKIRYHNSNGAFTPYFTVGANTKIFCVIDKEDVEDEEDRFEIGSLSTWPNGEVVSTLLEVYNVNGTGRAEAVVYKLDLDTATIATNTTKFGFVASVSEALSPIGDLAYKVVLANNNEYLTFYISKNSYILNTPELVDANGKLNLHPGDGIRYKDGRHQELTMIKRDFKYTSTITNSDENFPRRVTAAHDVTFYYGEIMDYQTDALGVYIKACSNKDVFDILSGFTFSKAYVWVLDTEDNSVTATRSDMLVTDKQNPDKGDKVVIRTNDQVISDILVIR